MDAGSLTPKSKAQRLANGKENALGLVGRHAQQALYRRLQDLGGCVTSGQKAQSHSCLCDDLQASMSGFLFPGPSFTCEFLQLMKTAMPLHDQQELQHPVMSIFKK